MTGGMTWSSRPRKKGAEACLFVSATVIAYALRFEGFEWAAPHRQTAVVYVLVSIVAKLYVAWSVGIYRRLWRYAGIVDVERLITSAAISGVICLALGGVVLPALGLVEIRVPLSVLFIDGLLTAAFAALPRLRVRALGRRGQRRRVQEGRRTLIVGAGAAGEMIVKELLGHPQIGLNPICFVDDDPLQARPPAQRRSRAGARSPILENIVLDHEIDEVIIAMPQRPGHVVRQVVRAALEVGVKTRTVPGIYDILSGQDHRRLAAARRNPGPASARADPDRPRTGPRRSRRARRCWSPAPAAPSAASSAGSLPGWSRPRSCSWATGRTRSSTSSPS